MNRFKRAAVEILKNSKEPLHYKDITKRAIEESLLKTGGATPESTMNAQITVEIKNKKDESDFIRVKPGVYALNCVNEKSEETASKINKKSVKKIIKKVS